MLRIHALEVNPPKAATGGRKAVMATKALTPYQRHVKAYAKAHPQSKNVIAAAARTWHPSASKSGARASKAAKRATRAVSRGAQQVTLRAVRKGAPVSKAIIRLARNPGEWLDRVKAAASGKTIVLVAGAVGGGAGAALLPMLLGSHNEGAKGVALSALATLLATGGAAALFPAAVVPVAAGGIIITGIRGAIVFIPKALKVILKPLLDWAGAPPANAPAAPAPSGPQAGWDGRRAHGRAHGAQAGFRGEVSGMTQSHGRTEHVEEFSGTSPVSY